MESSRHDEGGGVTVIGSHPTKPHHQATTPVVDPTPPPTTLFTTHTVRLDTGTHEAKAAEIRAYFHNTQDIYEALFRCLHTDEAYYIQPVHKLRHPMIFYFGHTAAFYINKLALAGLTTRINPKIEETVAVGVDEMSWDDLNSAHYDWPGVSEMWEYRRQVRQRIDDLLTSNTYTFNAPLTFTNSTENKNNTFWWTVMMAVEHERIHLETASVHVRELPLRLVRPLGSFWDPCPIAGEPPATNPLLPVTGGVVRLGRPDDSRVYGWDCDYGEADFTVESFSAAQFLTSNKEFLAFMEDGSYTKQEFWDEEGWSWVSWKKPEHPWFWVRATDGSYKLRTLVEEIDLPLSWPVEVNHLEARAYCRWLSARTGKTLRMPTEAEWTLMRDRYVGAGVDQDSWTAAPGNINLEHYRSSCPVNQFQNGPFFDIVGNVWQHTETFVYPFKGFAPHPLYDDFSMPTFDGRHAVMKGGAWISTGNEATRDARYAFRRHFFQYIGIRVVEGAPVDESSLLSKTLLGMDPIVDAAADFAYSKPQQDNETAFGARMAAFALRAFQQHSKGVEAKRALDLFCGGGRVSFELAPHFDTVIGSDFTARQLQTAFSMRERGVANYSVVTEFGEREARSVSANDFTWGTSREKAFFFQADPSNLHAHMTSFDLIVAWNVLENTYKPRSIPAHLISRLRRGGILILAAHYDYQPWVKPEDRIVPLEGGGHGGEDSVTTVDLIKGLLADSAELVETSEIHAVFPQTVRTGYHALMELLVFRKL